MSHPTSGTIKDYVDVRRHPTVVRLIDLEGDGARWLGESFLVTREVEGHLQVLVKLLRRDVGSGAFLIGHYGSGKSHLLAYLALGLRSGRLMTTPPDVVAVSLVNFSAANRLEDIIDDALGVQPTGGDRRPAWDEMLSSHECGRLLLVDELSEFLRAKPDHRAFTEDVRFLQFLGEWAQDRRFWIVAAMQESIEHTGELEYGLYRKIKDRYPLRLLLTPAHVQSLIADSILVKKPGYDVAVEGLCSRLGQIAEASVDFDILRAVYPLHPSTLDLLEEVRDRFSQARGVVDFTVTRLLGDAARGVEPFLEKPFGSLVTPDAIVDHFRDLLEVQPEFLPLAQQILPWYERHLGDVFDKPALCALADRILKLLILVHLSPSREALAAGEAAAWLLITAARVEPGRNRKVIEKVLATLAERGRYVVEQGGRYRLDLRDDSGAALERMLSREVAALDGQDALVLEALVPLLPAVGFNPFQLPRDRWQHRRLLWHFHERRYAVWLGDGSPEPSPETSICLRLPWGESAAAPGITTVAPAPIRVTGDLVELAALTRLAEGPGGPEVGRRIRQRIETRRHVLEQAMRSAWQEARMITPEGNVEPAPRLDTRATIDSWLETVALWVLRRTYPAFERFAPGHGPLPKEAWLRFMRFASREDIGTPLADDYVRLIREAYLVPMGLLRRKGQEYVTPANLDRHELVGLLSPLLEHSPSPRTIHEHMAQPIYGLVPDQVNLLLVFLLLQGEIDILKDRQSYRDAFETLPNPLHYDRVVPGHALATEPLAALERVCKGLGVATPAHWSVLTQRRCAAQLAEIGRRQTERLQPLAHALAEVAQGKTLAERIERHLQRWRSLEEGEHTLQGAERFLFEIPSPAAFAEEAKALRDLPDRIQRLLAESQRFSHLLGQESIRRLLPASMEGPGSLPDLDQPTAVEEWLRGAGRIYDAYKTSYRERHKRWWSEIAEHPIWSWQPPAVARSRHLDLKDTLEEIGGCQREAQARRCRGLVNLDYQPQCACGFDGEAAPVAALLERFERMRHAVTSRLQLFFEQDRVKKRLREWQREGVEVSPGTISYLEGTRSIPEVEDVASFDDFLDGVELAADVDVAVVIELLQHRLWQPDELIAELRGLLLAAGGPRLRFSGRRQRDVPREVLEWCARQCLQHGEPLPSNLTRKERAVVSESVRAEWVSPQALLRLEALGLDDDGVDRLLKWALEGQVALPEGCEEEDSLIGVVADVMYPRPITSAGELAIVSAQLYRVHERFQRLARERWWARLAEVAGGPLDSLPGLAATVGENVDAQWLIVDCLGLPLSSELHDVFGEVLSDWEQRPPKFVQVSVTTTDGCYRELLAAGIEHAFEKIDVIDEIIHDDFVPFPELVALARTKVGAACRRISSRLDPSRPLLIFADHGFRLSPDGRRWVHGGASTLERVVPVWRFEVRE